jgi:hypothetical protein
MSRDRIILIVAVAVAVVAVIALIIVAVISSSDSSQSLQTAPVYSFNVKDYGAVGDGVADDGPAISKAVAAAQGAILYFPSGSYYVATPVTLPVNWPAGWKGAVAADGTSWIKTAVTAPDSSVSWDFRWIEP